MIDAVHRRMRYECAGARGNDLEVVQALDEMIAGSAEVRKELEEWLYRGMSRDEMRANWRLIKVQNAQMDTAHRS